MVKLTTEEFITRAKTVHGDRYDYSKVEYERNDIPVIIKCPKHGEFKLRPDKHIYRHQGCPQCSIEKYGHREIFTQEEAKKRLAYLLKGTPYVLRTPLIFYTVESTIVNLHCTIHDFDWTTSWHHLMYNYRGRIKFGCKYCKIQYPKEVCHKAALNCKYRSEFAKTFKGEYFAALRNDWLDEICSHMVVVGNHYKRCIYAYEFPNIDGKDYVYVGLTNHIHQRDLEHGRKGAVYTFCRKHNLERPKPILLTEYIDKEEAKEQEGIQLAKYVSNGWIPLNRVKTGGLGGHLANDGFTFEECKARGQKYRKRSEWKREDYPTYYIASKRGWIDKILKRSEKFGNGTISYWTDERIAETALLYEYPSDFQKNEPVAYQRAYQKGILDKVCNHMKRKWKRLDYNIEMIKRKIDEYDNLNDFIDNNRSMRTWLSNHKINLRELTDKPYKKNEVEENKECKQFDKKKRQQELLLRNLSILELIKAEIEKYDTLTDFIANNKTMRGWLTKHKIKLRDISDKPFKERKGPSKPVHQFTLDGIYGKSQGRFW